MAVAPERGELERASASCPELVELWEDAGAELQPHVRVPEP